MIGNNPQLNCIMKKSIRLLLCLTALTGVAQQNPPPAEIPPPPVAPEKERAPVPAEPVSPPRSPKIRRAAVVEAAPAVPEPTAAPSTRAVRRVGKNDITVVTTEDGEGGGTEVISQTGGGGFGAGFGQVNQFLSRSGGKTSRTLIIPSAESDPKSISHAEEDLTIMSRILEKAVPRYRDDGGNVAMGISIDSTVLSPSSLVRNVYLEGYGALFILRVRMPLIAPPAKNEEVTEKEAASSDWDTAKAEVYGGDNPFDDLQKNNYKIFKSTSRSAFIEYDAGKVEELKTALLETLKNATHIRTLKPDEWITVAVMGSESMSLEKPAANQKVEPRVAGKVSKSKTATSHGESTLTIRVKKSDVDDFAKGKLDLDQFQKRARTMAYLRPQEPISSAQVLTMPMAR
jgi:hypothetical protein